MNKMRQWSMLTAVAVVVVMAAGWFLAVSPQRHKAADLRAQTASQQSSNASLQTQVQQLQQEKKNLPAQQRLLDQIATRIPDNPALPTLIRELTAAADGAGVDLVSMSPSPPTAVTAAATGAVAPTAGAAATPAASLNSISISLNVAGSYYNVESFIAAVEKLKRAMKVTAVNIAPLGGEGPAKGTSGMTTTGKELPSGSLNATLTALVYDSPAVVPTQTSPVAAAAPAN